MEITKRIAIITCFSVFFLLNYQVSYAERNNDLIDSIVNEVECDILEYGVDTVIYSKERINEEIFINLLCNELDNPSIKSSVGESQISIKIDGNNGKGELMGSHNRDGYKYILKLLKKDTYQLSCLKERISFFLHKNFECDTEYYLYVRCKLNESYSLKEVNTQVLRKINSTGASDVNTIKINNGFSTTANTHRYPGKLNNEIIKDLNFAVCNYSSGNYLIIGTPEITISY